MLNYFYLETERNGKKYVGIPLRFTVYPDGKRVASHYHLGEASIDALQARYGASNLETMELPLSKCTLTIVKSECILEDNKVDWRWLPRTGFCYYALNAMCQMLKSTRLMIVEHLIIKWGCRYLMDLAQFERADDCNDITIKHKDYINLPAK